MPAGGPWACPVCRDQLVLDAPQHRWACAAGHSFDVARQGYVNLLIAGQRRSREPGDSGDMVEARRRFLATGAFDRLSERIAGTVAGLCGGGDVLLLDVGCGEGHHTRRVAATVSSARVAGVDVSKAAVVHAARAHPSGFYAVASAADLPLADRAVDVALDVFGPVIPDELARVVRPAGLVVAAHPGPRHLAALRRLVYAEARPHEVKDPLRTAGEHFTRIGSETVRFGIVTADAQDLWAMTPYRWHAPPDIEARLVEASAHGFRTEVDVVVAAYRRRP